MTAVLVDRVCRLREFIGSVVELRDSLGILSVTIGIEPGDVSGRRSAWEIALQNDFAQLRREGGLKPAARVLDEALERVGELLDPPSPGRGLALYVALDSGATHELTLQRSLPTAARIGRVAHVIPLLEALDEGEPAALVMASRDGVVVLESELEHVAEVAVIELEPWIGDWWPEMKGPARANPLRGQHVVSQRDRYARRVAEAYRHTLDEAASALGSLARERGWIRGVLAGDPRTTGVLESVLEAAGVSTTTIGSNLEGVREEDARARLEAALAALVSETLVERVRVIEEGAEAGAKGACGLEQTLAALNEARVDTLLVDPATTYPGIAEPDEVLRCASDVEEAVDLVDAIVARALATGAEVVPVRGAASERLARCGGIAAHLRW
jgi:hypothetical protein